jgi:hypothetical protein
MIELRFVVFVLVGELEAGGNGGNGCAGRCNPSFAPGTDCRPVMLPELPRGSEAQAGRMNKPH